MNWMDELRRLLGRVGETSPVEHPGHGAAGCREAATRVFEWLDGELDPELEATVGKHLETCARCYPMLAFEKAFLEAVGRAAACESAPEELRERILRSLQTEGFREP